MPEITETDVIIVGAGPIGLEMAVALKHAGVEYVHLEARQVAYTISWFAPQTRFFSSNERIAIAGVPLQTPDGGKSTREQYLTYLRAVVEQFDLQVNTYEPVVGIERKGGGGGGFEVTTRPAAGAKRYRCNRLILATGGTDHPRKLNVPGEDLPHVDHYFTDPHPYFRKRLLIVGGKNSAVEAALRCHNAGAHVAISYRRDRLPDKSIKYWLLPEINTLIQAGRIQGFFNTVPTAITPTSVTLRSTTAGGNGDAAGATKSATHDVPADFVLALIGYEQDDTLFKLAGVERLGDCHAPGHDPGTMQTNVPGLYVIGTAVGGTQDKYSVFIENCHVHVAKVLASLTGHAASRVDAEVPAEIVAQPES
jgi:thioredoxin reductase (NADPH)